MMQGTLAFAGIGYCFHKNQHTELSIVYDRVPRPVQHVFDLISNGVMLFCCIYMVKYSWAFTMQKNIPMNTIPWMKQSWIYCFITGRSVVAGARHCPPPGKGVSENCRKRCERGVKIVWRCCLSVFLAL